MIREIANWFHEHDGELFTEEETPFTREQLSELTNDSVDPIQQIVTGGERYYGVISYDEHDGWYEYTRWDDAAGETTIGVCAQCVSTDASAGTVGRTVGDDTSIAAQKFEKHYRDTHSIEPSDVDVATGATLASGTTIDSNEAIHLGMDGSGSNVDADFVRGGAAIEENVAVRGYIESNLISESVFSSVGAGPWGVGIEEANDCIWHADDDSRSIYRLDHSKNIGTQFSSPSFTPQGVGVTSDGSIWNSDESPSGDGLIFELNQSGTVQNQFTTPNWGGDGVGTDSNDCIWQSDSENQRLLKYNHSGSVQNQFNIPGVGPRGVDTDSDDCLWHISSNDGSIYKTDQSGNIERSRSVPGPNSRGLGIDLNDILWISDNNTDSFYNIEDIPFANF